MQPFRRLAVATAVVAAAVLPAAPVGARTTTVGTYTPLTGAIFNKPIGTVAEQYAIFTHIDNTIDSTPAGATIRFAVYSFAEGNTASRLIAAYQRGVNVQLIFDNHHTYPAERTLIRALGSNPDAPSFVVMCSRSCRGTGGQMHDKFFLFSQAGSANNIVMTGSNNITRYNATRQWSDVYTVADDPEMFDSFSGIFNSMKYDTPVTPTYLTADVDGYDAQFLPDPGVTMATDPVYQELEPIECTGGLLRDGTYTGITKIRIAMHAWNGMRGRYLAVRVAQLESEGCIVRVVYGVGIGSAVRHILATAGVETRRSTHKGIHTHEKLMLLRGVYGADPAARIVWTGSHNWSTRALSRDDIVFRIQNLTVFKQYQANWHMLWDQG